MRADDDGFVSNPRKIIKITGASEDDLKILILKSFIIAFESGIIVIRHWKLNNYIQKDRYKETIYQEEKALINVDNNNVYNMDTPCIQNGYAGKVRLDKVSLDENNIYTLSEAEVSTSDTVKASKHRYGKYKNVLLKDQELQTLQKDFSNWNELIEYLSYYREMKGYKAKSDYLAIRKWVVDAVKREAKKLNTKEIEEWLNE